MWTENDRWDFNRNLQIFSQSSYASLLSAGFHGVEREALRVNADGSLNLEPHPQAIGDKFTHPAITTDFSESQLELITPPFPTIEGCYQYLAQLHHFVASNIGDQLLWPASMPCRLPSEEQIPIAFFGETPEAKTKEIYRRGLALRYGKAIQMVCGIHYNFSFDPKLWDMLHQHFGDEVPRQEFINDGYCALVRNFLRLRWLFVYLYGASPVVDRSYDIKALNQFHTLGPDTLGFPWATSLRMSQFGYSNEEQRNFRICFNRLESYIGDLRRAMEMPDPRYEALGLYRHAEQIQLNANVLQLENEYYAPVRFKQAPLAGETSLDALERAGVGYIEIRASDLNPESPYGLDISRLHFLHVLLTYCLLRHSDYCSRRERDEEINANERRIALEGRMSDAEISFCGKRTAMPAIARNFLQDMMKVAGIMDRGGGTKCYQMCIQQALAKLDNPNATPSARMVAGLQDTGGSFIDIMKKQAQAHHHHYRHYQGASDPSIQRE
ncbi:glutamate--cysteine ligase [Desulfurispira natronophila]|uniref:Glutamate--cysteine ligase n=1 Tax=Desulfurispira natronophila TaxID=682562 RepID=A0A7W7Y4B8_9BACT|nr:glutamate--cysteine ligase [Desulfurispira natronophila]MBB5021787.1 glutamate--cysteine ligase [Desulfurispira natronophila]